MEVVLKGGWRRLAVAVAVAALAAATWLFLAGSGGGPGGSTAHAAPPDPLDHFLCYKGQFNPSTAVGADITLRDQFAQQPVAHKVAEPKWFCNPTNKDHPGVGSFPIVHPNNHLTAYRLNGRFQKKRLHVINQFQTAQPNDPPNLVTDPGTAQAPKHPLILVPTQKAPHDPPADIDHYKCYPTLRKDVNQQVTVQDQFPPAAGQIVVQQATLLCNPAAKKHGDQTFPIIHPRQHLVCYTTSTFTFPTAQRPQIQLRDQFGQRQMTVVQRFMLCVPSKKSIVP